MYSGKGLLKNIWPTDDDPLRDPEVANSNPSLFDLTSWSPDVVRLRDTKMHAVLAKPYTWDEMTACNGHGTPAWHQRVAKEIAAEIRRRSGGPDQPP